MKRELILQIDHELVIIKKECTLFCTLDHNFQQKSLEFKLTDYRNSSFISNSTNAIADFYDGFKNSSQIIEWMRERPYGNTRIREVSGEKDIIVVIPTIDTNGEFAQRCRDEIYHGLHIIFVESGLPRDFYFNFANSCNVGVKKAMEYKPKWIICSNDDVLKIDDVGALKSELSKYDSNSILSVIPKSESKGFCFITSYNFLFRILSKFDFLKVFQSVALDMRFNIKYSVQCSFRSLNKLGKLMYIFLTKRRLKVFPSGQIRIVSGMFAASVEGNIYDSTYINGIEDFDLAIRLLNNGQKPCFINYRLGVIGGASLGNTYERFLRSAVSRIYLDYKIKKGQLKIE